jgi:glycosyltransferase involved in cell wall biosynthesis
MNLLIDAHVFDEIPHGARTYIRGLYSNLIEQNDITFYFVAKNVENLKNIFGERDNVKYIRLNFSNRILRLVFEFPYIIRKYKIDYAHFQYISPLFKCCKEIVTIHDLLFLDFPQYFSKGYRLKNNFFFKRSAQRADLLLTVSSYSCQEIVRHYKIEKDKIKIISNGILKPNENLVLPDIKEKYGLDKYILTVSRIEPRKNHITLLKAFTELNLWKNGYKLVFVGVYDLKSVEFDRYYEQLPEIVKNHVLIFSASYPELVSLYKNATLFVFPSLAEGFGIPPIEAAYFGCPTLCSNQTAMSDFDFLGDKLFNPYDEEELKQKMLYYLSQSNIDMTKEKLEIEERYDWKKIANQFLCEIIPIKKSNQL